MAYFQHMMEKFIIIRFFMSYDHFLNDSGIKGLKDQYNDVEIVSEMCKIHLRTCPDFPTVHVRHMEAWINRLW